MLDEDIVEWSVNTFPDLTIEQQLMKLESEFDEFETAEGYEKSLEELADVYIVCMILDLRFNSRIGKFMRDTIKVSCTDDILTEAVKNKMDINFKRKWHKNEKGEYRHDEDSSK